MKKIWKIVSPLFMLSILMACEKDAVDMVSLNKRGQKFYYGEKVQVWASTAGDLHDIRYDWKTTGGYFEGWRTQNLFENLWVAPQETGQFTVTATANIGNNESTRSTTMDVVAYFFDEFMSSTSITGWTTTNANAILRVGASEADSYVEVRNNANLGAHFKKSLDNAPFQIPFSVQTKFAWTQYYRPGQATLIRVIFKQPLENTNYPYLREIRWEVFQNLGSATYRLRYETYIPSSRVSTWADGSNDLPTLIDPVRGIYEPLRMAEDEDKTVSFSVGEDYIFHAHVDGQIWFQSDAIKQWLTEASAKYPGFEEPVGLEYGIGLPTRQNTTPTQPYSRIKLKSVYMQTDGTILR